MKTTNENLSVTKQELVSILSNVEKGTFAFLHIETKVRMNKTGNPYFDKVMKITKGNVLLGNSYQTRVQKETENPTFTPEKCNVGEHTSKCILHNEKLNRDYLQYEWFEEVQPKSEFRFEGDPIEKELFRDYMVKSSPNKYGVNCLSVMIDNIKEMTLNKVHYILE